MTDVTDADRGKAADVVAAMVGVPWDALSDAEWRWVDHVAAALAEEREKARAEVLAERGTCGDRSPAVDWIPGSGAEMCVLPPDHKGAHQAASDGVYAPMRWIRNEESQ